VSERSFYCTDVICLRPNIRHNLILIFLNSYLLASSKYCVSAHCGTRKARYTLETKLNSTLSTLLKVDYCRNRRQIGNTVDCSRYGQLCCQFWQQIGNNLNSTACSGQHCRQLSRLCRPNVERPFDSRGRSTFGRHCRQYVRDQSNTVNFVDFQQSRPC